MKSWKLAAGMLLGMLILTSGFAAGYFLAARRASVGFPLVMQARRLIDERFIGPLPDDVTLERGMIRGLVGSLGDRYTTYNEPAQHELQTDQLTGSYGGVGAQLLRDEAGKTLLVPFPGGPAERAGIVEGDVLTHVDDLSIEPTMSLDQISALIRGPVGSMVELTLARRANESDSREIRVSREEFPLPSITSYRLPDDSRIGVIVISVFSDKTPQELDAAFSRLVGEGCRAMILDLRGNSGGLLDSAVRVARYFLSDGLVLIEQRREQVEQTFFVESPGAGATLPLVVLVDGGTASAAEIVAAALQAHERAPLIGSPTFGKGSVQVVLEMEDGSSLQVTNARWLTPNRITLDGTGLQPDIAAATGAEGQDGALIAATGWLREAMRGDP
ncbi:MAG TPA: S41 family peptidase [Anaerolineales bacterium]|nr:S41 family peptidase [Anaerolineales bacterium]